MGWVALNHSPLGMDKVLRLETVLLMTALERDKAKIEILIKI